MYMTNKGTFMHNCFQISWLF